MPMDALVRVGFLAHTRSRSFQRKLDESLRICEKFVGMCEKPSASISFGKDSVAKLHLLRQFMPSIQCIHADRGEGGDTQEVYDLKAQLTQDWGLKMHTEYTIKTALECWNEDLPIRKYLIMAMAAAEQKLGLDGTALGITPDESKSRRIAIGKHGLMFQMASGLIRCYPIGHWRAIDVWAYTVKNNLPYLPIYDRYAEDGLSYLSPQSRTSNIIGTTGIERGRLQRTAKASEEAWEFYQTHGIRIW